MKIPKDERCPHCGRYDNRPNTIDAIVVKNGKFLLIKRGSDPDRGKWATVGGYVDWDETLEQTVRREVKEETGLRVTNLKFLNFSSDPKRHPDQSINHVYMVWAEGNLKPGDDATEAKWFAFDKIPKDMAFDTRQSLLNAQKKLTS